MNKQLHRFFGRDEEEGQALVLFAIVTLALLFAVGLAIDAGQLFAAKRTEQEAADAAAFAGAVVIYQHGTTSEAVAAAIADATKNGFTDGVNSTSVTVNGCAVAAGCVSAPTSGAYAGETP